MIGKQPGLYLGLSNEEYHADPALSSSGVKQLLKSPFKYWWNSALNPHRPKDEKTAALKLGEAYHMLMLEPERFSKSYAVKYGVKSTSIANMLGEEDYKMLYAMRASLMSNIRRAALLQGGVAEASLFWKDEKTGIMCRCRFDYFAPEWVVDLKTTTSIDSQSLRYDIPRYGYDVSGAMYSEGVRALRKMVKNGYALPEGLPSGFAEKFMKVTDQGTIFAFILQEKEEPYIARTKLMTQPVTAVGLDKVRSALTRYGLYQNLDGAWPTGFDDVEDLLLEDLSDSINYF